MTPLGVTLSLSGVFMAQRRELSYTSAKALFSRTAGAHPVNRVMGSQSVARGGIRF